MVSSISLLSHEPQADDEHGQDSEVVGDVGRRPRPDADGDREEPTVFNYFPTKEDLCYSGMEAFEARLVDAVRDRPSGESVRSAFRRFVLDGSKRLTADDVADVQRALVEHVRAHGLGGLRGPKLATGVRSQARRAFTRLESGLGGYGIKAR